MKSALFINFLWLIPAVIFFPFFSIKFYGLIWRQHLTKSCIVWTQQPDISGSPDLRVLRVAWDWMCRNVTPMRSEMCGHRKLNRKCLAAKCLPNFLRVLNIGYKSFMSWHSMLLFSSFFLFLVWHFLPDNFCQSLF